MRRIKRRSRGLGLYLYQCVGRCAMRRVPLYGNLVIDQRMKPVHSSEGPLHADAWARHFSAKPPKKPPGRWLGKVTTLYAIINTGIAKVGL